MDDAAETTEGERGGDEEGDEAPLGSRKRGRRLGSAENVRAALAWIFREVEADRMPPVKAKTLTYVANTLLTAINGNLEERLVQLEEKLGGLSVSWATVAHRIRKLERRVHPGPAVFVVVNGSPAELEAHRSAVAAARREGRTIVTVQIAGLRREERPLKGAEHAETVLSAPPVNL